MRAAALLFALAACAPVPVTPERAAEICEEKARAAQGPTGSVTVGTNSNTGGFGGVEIGVSSDFLAGRDPLEVYNECIFDRTGASPIRPPVLR
ncbi:hypothetical protein [Octadecabacter ascidiaceicola]|uniref:Uncharacterized protein n=1 Tax=Octadecabacter ascidiaceicola TaxID=1655543 RepID=A0A238K9K8_9RHOB|nr:hypothetical protein [Octadecabacter ascidiaceicola]SMX39157.1 hypothetical protein OCA8868_01862 [Octadecabacter ascidiaceicola]